MNRIKKLRESSNETQEELGKILNVSKATISKYENGTVEMSNDTLIKLANHFNVSTDYILGRTNIPDMLNEPIQIAASMKDGLDISDMDDDEKKFINDFIKMVRNKKK